MFEEVRNSLNHKLTRNRTPGANFDEVTYADDRICFSVDSKTMSQVIQAIEEEGSRCGSNLNTHRCELPTADPNANIHFGDKTKVPKVRLAIYLGCKIGIHTNSREELSKIFADCMSTIGKLDQFRRHSN